MLETFREIIFLSNELIQQLPDTREIRDKFEEFNEWVNKINEIEREYASTSRFNFKKKRELKERLEKEIEKAKKMANELLDANERLLLSHSSIVRDFASKHSNICDRALLVTVQKLPEQPSLGDITVKVANVKNILSTLRRAFAQIKNDVLKWINSLETEVTESIFLIQQISEKIGVPISIGGDSFLKEIKETKSFLEQLWKIDVSSIENLISKIKRNYESLRNDMNTSLSTLITSFKSQILQLREDTRLIEDILVPPFPTIHINLSETTTGSININLLRTLAKDVEAVKLFEDDVKRRLLNKIIVLMRRNKSKMEVFQKYIEIDSSKLSLTLKEIPTIDEPLNSLLIFLKDLKEEEEYLNKKEKAAINGLKSELRSKLIELSSKTEIIIEEGVKLSPETTRKINFLSSQIENIKDVDTALSLEMEYTRLLEEIKDAIKREFLSERGRVIEAVGEFLGEIEAPSLRGQTIEELLQNLQELKRWKTKIRNLLKEKATKIIDELERGNTLLKGTSWVNSQLPKTLTQMRKEIRATNKIEEIIEILNKIINLKSDEEQRLKAALETVKKEYVDVIKTIEDLVVDIPTSIRAPIHVDVENKTYIELTEILPELEEKIKQRDKLVKETLESFLLKIKNEIERIPPAYRESFNQVIQEIDNSIINLRKVGSIYEVKEAFNLAIKEINNLLKEKFSALKSSLILKTRMAFIKTRNPPDVSDAVEKLNGVIIEQWEVSRAIYEVDKIFQEEILGKLREFIENEAKYYIDLLNKLKMYNIEVEEFIIKLKEVLARLSSKKEFDIQEIGDLGKIVNDVITSSTLRQTFAKWLSLTVDALEKTLNYVSKWVQVEEDFYEVIPTLKKQSELLDTLEIETITKMIEHTHKLWEIARSYLEEIEKQRDMIFEEELKKIPYHDSIMKIWDKNRKKFDKMIFPLSKLFELKEEISNEQTPKVLKLIEEKEKLEREWLEKEQQISIWHKSVKVFLTGISPMDSEEVKERKLREIKEKIKRIYKRKDVQTYLILATQTLLGD